MRKEILEMGLPVVLLLALRTSPVPGQETSQSVAGRGRVVITYQTEGQKQNSTGAGGGARKEGRR